MAILGTNIILYYNNGSSDIPFGSATNCILNTTTELLQISSSYSAWFVDSVPNLSTWEVTCDGFISNGNFEYKQMLDAQLARTPINIKFSIGTSPAYIISGTANITSINATGPVEAVATYRITLQGSGRYIIS